MNQTHRPHIVVVDDDQQIRELLSQVLDQYGFSTRAVADGRELTRALAEQPADLIVLDLMLPGDDGLSICRELRTRSATPVIMLTARGESVDRVVGLEVGADDYVAKPFDPRELVARIRTVLRRASATPGAQSTRLRGWSFDGWSFDAVRRELRDPEGAIVALSSLEFRLLELLLQHANQVLTRDRIMEATAGRPADPFERRIDIAISRLRARLRDDGREPRLIKTVRNRGYVLTAEISTS
ncbi:MAG: Two-component system, OmpR family, response regulator [Hydrocarboniphaga sp.]|uniref:response regulator n=1 Tax=Hydrocarboniphaga sp. TaxID=2033016 RepID=UPI0026253159|nr:response regulator [Hydrocarboniphaga sp.]MDB5969546.1 Two-component system, OmpR family, response regulator [Hydrocarboniphaga sp.]